MIKNLFLVSLLSISFLSGCKSKDSAPIATFTSQELYKEFVVNPEKADQNYVGKTLKIEGTVIKKGVDTGQRPYLNLAGDPVLGDVQCFFATDQEAKAAKIAIGTPIKVVGTCYNRVIHVTLDYCKFID